jgi:hypothetical protein
MKRSHKLHSQSAAPFWLLSVGLLVSIAGVALWCRAMTATSTGQTNQSLAVSAVLLGVIATVYAAHELSQRRRR